jgi:hypothetical protein
MFYLLLTNDERGDLQNVKTQIIPQARAEEIIERIISYSVSNNGVYTYTMEHTTGTLIPIDIPMDDISMLADYLVEAEKKDFFEKDKPERHIYKCGLAVMEWIKTFKKGYPKPELIFEKATQTLRQMPQNYLIAEKRGNAWICEPDIACNNELAIAVFKALLEYRNKYGTAENLLKVVGF